jgi:hypothetical protein
MTAKRFEKSNKDKEVAYLLLEEGYYPEVFRSSMFMKNRLSKWG